jgi:integrase
MEAARLIADLEHRTISIFMHLPLYSEIAQAAEDNHVSIDAYLLGLHDARMASRAGELLTDYLKGFWMEGSLYIKAKEAARSPLSATYMINSRSGISKYVLPWIARKYPDLTLQGTRPTHLEELKQHLVDKGLGPSRVNGVMKAVRVALGEAWRLEAIVDNPARKVKKLPDPAPKREVFSMEEARRFFAVEGQDARYSAASLTAALAGLRLGEIRGLQAEDLRETIEHYMDKRGKKRDRVSHYLHVCHNWQDLEPEGRKMKGPKHSTEARSKDRDVPIPEKLHLALLKVTANNPYGDGFVFWGDTAGVPPSSTIIEQHYRSTVHAMGISEEERRRRGLTFHAWRHWYNTHMRPHLPDYQLRMLTGHTSEALTDRYTEITEEQRAAVGRVASGLLE